MTGICRACEENKHDECEGYPSDGCLCACPCQGAHGDPDYATDEKLMWADLRRKERKESS